MRFPGLIPLLLVAACGGGSEEKNDAALQSAAPEPGQWELATEVTAFRQADEGAPKIAATVGDRAIQNLCIAAADQLPAAFFAGEGYNCTYATYYVRNGRLNVTLDCRRDGLDGIVGVSAEGQSQGGSAEFTRNVQTALSTDGDVEIATRVTARRTGECAAAPQGGNQSEDQAG